MEKKKRSVYDFHVNSKGCYVLAKGSRYLALALVQELQKNYKFAFRESETYGYISGAYVNLKEGFCKLTTIPTLTGENGKIFDLNTQYGEALEYCISFKPKKEIKKLSFGGAPVSFMDGYSLDGKKPEVHITVDRVTDSLTNLAKLQSAIELLRSFKFGGYQLALESMLKAALPMKVGCRTGTYQEYSMILDEAKRLNDYLNYIDEKDISNPLPAFIYDVSGI